MPRLYADRDRYPARPENALVEATDAAIRDMVRSCVAASDRRHGEIILRQLDELVTAEKVEAVERRILDSGYRFTWSSALSLRDRPDIYASEETRDDGSFSFEHEGAVVLDAEPGGRQQRGTGDNVTRTAANTIGRAMYLRTSEKVLDLMRNGVPADTIAVIDDSGGTLTAPILDRFKGVICAGGTIRSHLGILTREYGIPCLMNARVSGIRDGDTVEIESSAPARTAESYAAGVEMPARIWKLP